MKDENHISWEEYFMNVAILSSKRSKDPNTKVGACIVDSNKRIVGVGYNGFPNNISDDSLSWDRDDSNGILNTKYPYVVHAECNAIMNSCRNLDECTLYVTLFPCENCTKMIIQSGICTIVYLEDKYNYSDENIAAKKMLDLAKIKYRYYDGGYIIK